jgi:hypothetical protein
MMRHLMTTLVEGTVNEFNLEVKTVAFGCSISIKCLANQVNLDKLHRQLYPFPILLYPS